MNYGLDKGYLAQAATTQWYCVKMGTVDQSCTPVTATGDFVLGVAQEPASATDVTNGKIINVRLQGIARCIAGAALGRGVRVRAHSSGKVVALAGTAGTNENVVGITQHATAADGDVVDVLLTPGSLSNSAVS